LLLFLFLLLSGKLYQHVARHAVKRCCHGEVYPNLLLISLPLSKMSSFHLPHFDMYTHAIPLPSACTSKFRPTQITKYQTCFPMPVIMHEHPLSHTYFDTHVFLCTPTLKFLVTLILMLMYHLIAICTIFFVMLINQHALTFIPTGHTRVTNSSAPTVDLMLSTSPELNKSCETIPSIGQSDHNDMLSTIFMRSHPAAPQVPTKIWRFNFAEFKHANEIVSQVNASSVIVDGDVGASWSNLFLKRMEKCIHTSTLPKRRDMHFRKSKISSHYLLKHRRAYTKVTSLL